MTPRFWQGWGIMFSWDEYFKREDPIISKKIPTGPWNIPPGTPKKWLRVWGMFQGYVGVFLDHSKKGWSFLSEFALKGVFAVWLGAILSCLPTCGWRGRKWACLSTVVNLYDKVCAKNVPSGLQHDGNLYVFWWCLRELCMTCISQVPNNNHCSTITKTRGCHGSTWLDKMITFSEKLRQG